MVEYELKDGILIAENFIEKWKKYGIVIAKKTSRIIEEPTVFPLLRPIDWSKNGGTSQVATIKLFFCSL
ncbi:MAG: hypothetical protein WCF97_03480 [Nitrososphaeraceae archaeon]